MTGRKPTVLFADDDAAMRRLVEAMMKAHGFAVRTADGGDDAIRKIRSKPPDLAILDYRMGSPDGLEVCRRIKENPRLSHIPVLILTGEGRIENRLDGFAAGADDYLAKPFDPRELLARTGALLRLSRSGLDRNPTSGLPGGDAIYRELGRWKQDDREAAVCYLDLDDFKPFADHFGFQTADAVIHALGSILDEATVNIDRTFVGHVGGDDFILLAEPGRAAGVLARIREEFERRLHGLLPAEVVERGRYRGEDRSGTIREFPLTRLSIAVVHIPPGDLQALDHLGERVAIAKRAAKRAAAGRGPSGGIVEFTLAELDGLARSGADPSNRE